jgi:hypothetical protein
MHSLAYTGSKLGHVYIECLPEGIRIRPNTKLFLFWSYPLFGAILGFMEGMFLSFFVIIILTIRYTSFEISVLISVFALFFFLSFFYFKLRNSTKEKCERRVLLALTIGVFLYILSIAINFSIIGWAVSGAIVGGAYICCTEARKGAKILSLILGGLLGGIIFQGIGDTIVDILIGILDFCIQVRRVSSLLLFLAYSLFGAFLWSALAIIIGLSEFLFMIITGIYLKNSFIIPYESIIAIINGGPISSVKIEFMETHPKAIITSPKAIFEEISSVVCTWKLLRE